MVSSLIATREDVADLTCVCVRDRFMPADALWTFAMACNVYLSFFHRYDATKLRALEWRYLVACYGIPFVPALVFLFIETEKKGKLYGDAVVSFLSFFPGLNIPTKTSLS